jgi:chromosome segregation ATPase
MNYSLEKIDTVEACDALLATAQTEKENLERRRRNLGESIGNFDGRTGDVSNELASVQALLQTFTTAYNSLPEGKDKVDMNIEIKQLEARKAQLDKSVVSYNVSSLLGKQVDYNLLDSQVPVIDAYIAAVQNKRTEIGTGA